MRRRLMHIDFACNDPDNGAFHGKAPMASWNECEFETRHGGDVTFTIGSGPGDGEHWIRVHRQKFRFRVSKAWIGNWCWDRFTFDRAEGVRLLKHLRANGWKCTAGPCRLYDWFNNERRTAAAA